MSGMTPFTADTDPPVRGWLHAPERPSGDAFVLAHGAGSNCDAPLLVAVAEALRQAGFTVLRCDLPFRQQRRFGPPLPGNAARDRAGLRNAARAVADRVGGQVCLGGHSYGGRQASMLVAEEPAIARGLLLVSYPLHPPRQPAQLRTSHFPDLRIPIVFVHGTRDPFASPEELKAAVRLIPAPTVVVSVDGAGHDLLFSPARRTTSDARPAPPWIAEAVEAFLRLVEKY